MMKEPTAYVRDSGGLPPPKLSTDQFADLCETLETDQPWTPREIHALIKDQYGVTYDLAHLSRKLRAAGMHYAKPRPMDPCQPTDAEEILAERLDRALGKGDEDTASGDHAEDETEVSKPPVLGYFR